MTKRIIPDLRIDELVVSYGEFESIDGIRAQDISNEMAAVLFTEEVNFRTSMYALARVLGWVAFLLQEKMTPDDFMKSVAEQSLSFFRAFEQELSPPGEEP